MTNATVEKIELRRTAKAARARAFALHGRAASEQIAAGGLSFIAPAASTVVSGFAAIGEEIDPLPLMRRLAMQGIRLALPVMQGKGRRLLFRAWAEGDAMAETLWGIREPLAAAPALEPSVLLVPLLAFDRQGWRLGYGGGFYDRTLADLRSRGAVVAVGLAFAEQEVDAVPHLDYDQPLDWVLTPEGPVRCTA